MVKKFAPLQGLGPTSRYQLRTIGISTKADLQNLGVIATFMTLKRTYRHISLNFLYAMVGILEDKHWREIAATRREELLLQIDDYKALEAVTASEHHAGPLQDAAHENALRSD